MGRGGDVGTRRVKKTKGKTDEEMGRWGEMGKDKE
jgi:hypothetical protein